MNLYTGKIEDIRDVRFRLTDEELDVTKDMVVTGDLSEVKEPEE